MVGDFVIETCDVSAARMPSVPGGTALVFTPALAHDLDAISSERPLPSDLALKAHALEDRPGAPIEDPDEIRALLGV